MFREVIIPWIVHALVAEPQPHQQLPDRVLGDTPGRRDGIGERHADSVLRP